MVNSLLSPCLYLENNELKNLGELIEVLDFISRFLDVNIDLSNLSILCEGNWYSFPKYKPTIYNQFATCVVPLFKKLKNRVIINQDINKNIKYHDLDRHYTITDLDEFNCVVSCIQSTKNYLLFVGNINKDIGDTFTISINSVSLDIPTVKDVWLDESGNFDNLIRKSAKNYNDIFPCRELCSKIGHTVQEIGNKSLFKKYAKIIAERNGYHRLPYSSRQYKNVPYYIRNDDEYIICLDTLHGLFEVFKRSGNTYENYKGEYDFSCSKVSGKTSSVKTHICYKNY